MCWAEQQLRSENIRTDKAVEEREKDIENHVIIDCVEERRIHIRTFLHRKCVCRRDVGRRRRQ